MWWKDALPTLTHTHIRRRTHTHKHKRHTDDTHMYTRCCCFWEQQFYCCLLTTGLTIDVRVVLPNYVRCLYVNMQAIEMYINMFSAAFCYIDRVYLIYWSELFSFLQTTQKCSHNMRHPRQKANVHRPTAYLFRLIFYDVLQ